MVNFFSNVLLGIRIRLKENVNDDVNKYNSENFWINDKGFPKALFFIIVNDNIAPP